MALARKCDICGRYYATLIQEGNYLPDDDTSMVRILARKPNDRTVRHDVMHFDVCEECKQNVLDFILSKQADATGNSPTIAINDALAKIVRINDDIYRIRASELEEELQNDIIELLSDYRDRVLKTEVDILKGE